MFKKPFNTRINFFVICALSAILLLTACSIDTPADIPLQGSFSRGNWQINLSDSGGTGTFVKVGSEHHQVGEPFFTTDTRINYNTWHGVVYDKNFKSMKPGTITIDGDKLVITPDGNKAYILMRTQANSTVLSDTTANSTVLYDTTTIPQPIHKEVRTQKQFRNGESDCDAVQCHGTTRKGNQCKRTTRNCSGYCYQH